MITTASIQKSIATGAWKPNLYLTNLSTAYFQEEGDFAFPDLFPVVPVPLAAGHYYKFDKASLARDNMSPKPMFGKAQPIVMGHTEDSYSCKVDQGIIGIDQISQLNYERSGAPGVIDPRKAKVRVLTEQAKLHLDVMFAENYFKAGVWGQEWAGVAATPTANQFWQFDNDNCDPIKLVDTLRTEIHREGRRRPNKIGIGVEAFNALKENPIILERIKYTGTTANPAMVNERVLAELFGVQKVKVLTSTVNKAPFGVEADMQYVCDPKGMLLLYAPDAPAIDEPSAGYTFSWDMLGNGQPMALSQWLGESGTHSEFIEALCAYDMKKTGDDLAIYLKDCVSGA